MKTEDCFVSGRECYKQGDFFSAIACFEKVLIQNPEHEPCYFYLGLCYESIQYETKAIAYYQRGMELCKVDAYVSDYHLNMGKCYIMLSELEKALSHFSESEKYPENFLLCQHNKAIVLTCQKKYEEALKLFEYVWKKGIQSGTAKRYMAYCTEKVGKI